MPVYVTKVDKDNLYCLDRECKTRKMKIESTEALFKMALDNKQYGDVMRMVHHSRLCGQAIIAYLQQKGFPEVALHFVRDPKTRFRLALACGNIEVAMETVDKLGEDESMHQLAMDCWQQLGIEATVYDTGKKGVGGRATSVVPQSAIAPKAKGGGFCGECGASYDRAGQKFCMECGAKA